MKILMNAIRTTDKQDSMKNIITLIWRDDNGDAAVEIIRPNTTQEAADLMKKYMEELNAIPARH